MKKIYSFVLMAAMLLIGTNAWAITREANDATSFENAWAAAENGDVIQLTGPVSISKKTFWLGSNAMNGAFKSITLDLNGQTLTASDDETTTKLFVISHGELKVKTSQAGGQIIHSGAKNDSKFEIFRVMGSTYKNVDPSKEKVAYYSHLVIDNGVTLTAKANGVVIDYATWGSWSTNYVATKDAGSKPSYDTNVYKTDRGTANGARVDIFGTIYAHKYAVKANGCMGSPDTAPTARSGYFEDPAEETAYTVLATDVQYSPYIYIHDGARLETLDKSETYAIAAYSGGYSRWMIEGTCVGSTGVYVKSGQLTINNATVASNYTGTYEPAVQDRNSGVDAAGSGIVMESATAYAGGIDVTVSGNTTVTPTSGYAVDESITQNSGSGDSKVDGITITGGTFNEGGEGTISITQTTAGTSGSSTQKVEITGGTIEAGEDGDATSIGGQTLQQFLTTQTDNTHAVVVEVDEFGHETVVVSNGTAPVQATSVIATADGKSCNWISTTDVVETLTTDKTLTELQITSADYNQKLIVSDGVTLSVGRVVLGAKAQIVVEAGGKLVVTGAQGLASFQESNLVLKNENGKRSIFLFDPSVTSNTHPMATVELITNSWYESASEYQWENFGLPTYNAATSISCDKVGGNIVYEELQVLNGSTWTSLGYIGGNYNNPAYSGAVNPANLNVPFAAYNIIAYCAQDAERPKCRVTGELVGNTNANLNAYLKWTPFANSYTAPIDIFAFLTALKTSATNVDYHAIYVAEDGGNGSLVWNAKEEDDAEEDNLKIAPMQAFLLNNKGAYTEVNTLNYNDAVYTPATTSSSSAPARRKSASDNATKMRIFVTNEDGLADNVKLRESDIDNFEFEKYMNEELNIYAMTEEKSAIVAAEDIENTYLGVSTVKGGYFTISFANVQGREFDLIDLENGAKVAIAEGETYKFHLNANTVADYRFKVVAHHEVPTAIDNVEAAKNIKGIYTITGQYVGEMNVWNSLPAGVYVVNGTKLVK